MGKLFEIFTLGLLLWPLTATGQYHEEPISTNFPYEPTPLDSLIHYPEVALKNRIEGKVNLQAYIGMDGWADQVNILNSSNPVFNTEAIRIILTTHFEHDPKNKTALARMLIGKTITFELNNKRSLITTSHNADAYCLRVLVGWSKKDGLIYDESKLEGIADLDPELYKPQPVIPLDRIFNYPEEARKKGIEGKVIVQALIDKEDGEVSNVEIFKPDNQLLNDEAIKIITKARFSPSSGNSWTLLTLDFSLRPGKGEPTYSENEVNSEPPIDGDVSDEPHELTPLQSLIQYPEEAKKNGIEGKVTLMALVGRTGTVEKVEIIKSSNTLFNKEAARVLKSARFEPARQNGTSLRMWITRTLKFKLDNK